MLFVQVSMEIWSSKICQKYWKKNVFFNCSGFDGVLTLPELSNIGIHSFVNTSFSSVVYNGDFPPNCDMEIGFFQNQTITINGLYVFDSFCEFDVIKIDDNHKKSHTNKKTIVIAYISVLTVIVVAAVAVIIIFIVRKTYHAIPSVNPPDDSQSLSEQPLTNPLLV